jgi:cytidylate kinase
MADMMKDAMLWLEAQRTEHMTRLVTYQRGAASVVVSATIGRTTFEVDRTLGIHEEIQSRDYLINAEDLVLDGNQVEPAAGDRIVELDGTKQFTYELSSPLGNEPAWRYSDDYRLTVRCHTKLVAIGAAP